MTYESARNLAERISKDLADQGNTKCCPVCISEFACRLNDDGDLVAFVPRLRIDCHALFDACVLHLVLPRDTGLLERFARRLRANRGHCSFHAHNSIYRNNLSSDEYLNYFWEAASHVFAAGLQAGDGAFAQRLGSASRLFSDKHGRWPVRAQQLFPGGPRTAVETLLSHCERFISIHPLDTLCTMIVFARSAVLPVLTDSTLRPRLITVILKMLDPETSGITLGAPWMVSNGDSINSGSRMLQALLKGPGASPEDAGTLLFSGHEASVLRVVGTASAQLGAEHPLRSSLRSWWYAMANRGGVSLPPHLAPPILADQELESEMDAEGELSNRNMTIQGIYYLVTFCMRSRGCAGPGCTLSSFQNQSGKPFPLCARCKVPRYCSRACQRADWKGDGGVPVAHKRLCGGFVKLSACECPRLTLDEFKDVFARAESKLDAEDVHALTAYVSDGIRAAIGRARSSGK